VILLRELARFLRATACREEPLSPIVDSAAFAASSAQHLPIIFLIDNAVRLRKGEMTAQW
jgi:hypothetical protein